MNESISAKEFIKRGMHKTHKLKYRNVKTVVDGITFDSKKEAQRYAELRMMELAGEIKELECQKKYALEVGGQLICNYKCDFYYLEFYQDSIPITISGFTGISVSHRLRRVIEDVKSPITRKNPVYRIKKKLMKAIYDIDILET